MRLPCVIPELIRAVCFDAVGTLIFPNPPAPIVYAEMGRRFCSRVDEDTVRQRFRRAFAAEEQRDLDAGWRTSEERELQRWRNIVAAVLDDTTDPEACFRELHHHFSRPEAWRCADHAGEVLARLASRFRLALASNYDHRLRSVLAGLPELRPISHLIISSEVGWRKPARQFFAAVCEALALPPEQILFIGDDLVNDYDGARAAGLEAWLIDPAQIAPPGIRRIRTLEELS